MKVRQKKCGGRAKVRQKKCGGRVEVRQKKCGDRVEVRQKKCIINLVEGYNTAVKRGDENEALCDRTIEAVEGKKKQKTPYIKRSQAGWENLVDEGVWKNTF